MLVSKYVAVICDDCTLFDELALLDTVLCH